MQTPEEIAAGNEFYQRTLENDILHLQRRVAALEKGIDQAMDLIHWGRTKDVYEHLKGLVCEEAKR